MSLQRRPYPSVTQRGITVPEDRESDGRVAANRLSASAGHSGERQRTRVLHGMAIEYENVLRTNTPCRDGFETWETTCNTARVGFSNKWQPEKDVPRRNSCL